MGIFRFKVEYHNCAQKQLIEIVSDLNNIGMEASYSWLPPDDRRVSAGIIKATINLDTECLPNDINRKLTVIFNSRIPSCRMKYFKSMSTRP